MDGLEFTSKLIEHGAWPAIAVYVAVTQKDGIKTLLARMSKFKAPGMEAEFDTKAEKAAEKIDERAATPVAAPKLEPSVVEQVVHDAEGLDPANARRVLDTLLQRLPEPLRRPAKDLHSLHDERLRASGRIIEEWANLDETIRLLGATKGYRDARAVSTSKLINRLVEIGVISPSTAESIKDLRALRNQVAHTQIEPTKEAAENFADSCWKVEKRIIEEEAAWQEAATKLADEMLAEIVKPK